MNTSHARPHFATEQIGSCTPYARYPPSMGATQLFPIILILLALHQKLQLRYEVIYSLQQPAMETCSTLQQTDDFACSAVTAASLSFPAKRFFRDEGRAQTM